MGGLTVEDWRTLITAISALSAALSALIYAHLRQQPPGGGNGGAK